MLSVLAESDAALRVRIPGLHVLSREYTGVGSFTNFRTQNMEPKAVQRTLELRAKIHTEPVPSGLGAVLFLDGDEPASLEFYTYGDERWDGTYDEFQIQKTT